MSAGSVRPDVHDTSHAWAPGREVDRGRGGQGPAQLRPGLRLPARAVPHCAEGGKCAGRSRNRGPEKVVTDALGILLTAERTSLPSSRDDAFVAVVLKGYTGMRWGEVVGL